MNQIVSFELAQQLVDDQFPQLAPHVVKLLGQGWDNTVYLVDAKGQMSSHFAFRFPHRPLAADCLAVEIALLPTLVPMLPVFVPAPILIGEPSDSPTAVYPYPFAGYPFARGLMAYRAALTDGQRIQTAVPLAHFLKTLHSFPISFAQAKGVPLDTLGRFELGQRVPQLLAMIDGLVARGVLEKAAPWQALVEETAVSVLPPALVLCHGDLNVRNFLLSEEGEITAVIDWGDLHIGNPAVDIALAAGFLPPDGQAQFCKAYGSIPTSVWQRARFRALHLALTLLDHGIKTLDQLLVNECWRALQFVKQKS